MISTEPGPDEVLEARIRQALAGERFTVPTATITGRMSRHRRRTWVAVLAAAVAAVAAVVPVLTSIGSDREPVIKPPVILPGPTGTTLDEACQSAGLAELAAANELRPAERSALPPLRYASDLDGVRIYASHRVALACRWSVADSRVDVELFRPPQPEINRLIGADLDHVSVVASGHGYAIGGLPPGVVAVEIELSDATIVPATVSGDMFVATWPGSPTRAVVRRVTAISRNTVYARITDPGDSTGSESRETSPDTLGAACLRDWPLPKEPPELLAASEAMGYRIYRGVGEQMIVCAATGFSSAPVEHAWMNLPAEGKVEPTVTRVGTLGFIIGRGNATDVELQVGSQRLRPAIHDGFYAAAVRGAFHDTGLTRWVWVDPGTIYTGTGTSITSAIPRE